MAKHTKDKVEDEYEDIIVPRGETGNVGDGSGLTFNFNNPYTASIFIFMIGIWPTAVYANIYTVPIFIFLVILPFIIRFFRKNKNSN